LNSKIILDNLSDMIIILNTELKVIEYNKSAKSNFPLLENNKQLNKSFNANPKELERLNSSFQSINSINSNDSKFEFIFYLEDIFFYFKIKKIEKNYYLIEILNLFDSHLHNFLNSINSGWVICKPDFPHEVIYVNDNFLEVTGYLRKEILGKNLNILKTDNDNNNEREKIREALKNHKPVKVVLKNKTKNGNFFYNKLSISPIFNEHSGRLQFFLGIQNDITKEFKDKLYYKSILNTTKSIILTTDGIELKSINKRFFEIFPFENLDDFKSKYKCVCELFIEKKSYYITALKDGKIWIEQIKENPSQKNTALFVHKVCMIDKNANERIFQVELAGNFSEDNEKIEEVVVFTEITELLSMQKILKQQSKMAAMGNMLSMIAHQWRQPLTTLTSIVSKFKIYRDMNLLTDEKFDEGYKKSQDVINYMSNTINDFRSYFDKKDKNKDNIVISQLVSKSIIFFEADLKNKNIDLQVNFKGDIKNIRVWIHSSKMIQILVNLIKNAYEIILEKNPKNKFIRIDISYDNELLKILVEDSAGGIPENIIEKIFDPYFSTKGKNGTGIGLYMSRLIIEEQLNGKLLVENTKNGAKFMIELLLTKEEV
jgi:PAS domain S-box-containing protein